MSADAYVIAEAGSCHDSDPRKFAELIEAAKKSGADAVKFQWTSDPYKMAARRGKAVEAGYANVYLKYLSWHPDAHAELKAMCDAAQIDYLCTVYLPEDIAVVEPFVDMFKVASFEALDDQFVSGHLGRGKHVLVSIGMCEPEELAKSVAWNDEDVTLMQCTSAYPAPVGDLHLSVIGDDVKGFSDHSAPNLDWTGALACARGATTIEAHLRLYDTKETNPDFAHAMTPSQFTAYVRHIRFAGQSLGDPIPQRCKVESEMSDFRVSA